MSVGTAHAHATNQDDIRIQLEKLRLTVWDVKSVLSQVGVGNSVILMIHGTMLPNFAGGKMLLFSHSVTLVLDGNRGYQIHNDAISIMRRPRSATSAA